MAGILDPACYSQAFGIKPQDLHARRLVAAGLCTASLQDEKQQTKRDAFGRFREVHWLGLFFSRLRRAFSQAHNARVFDYRFAFRKYQPLNGWVRLSARVASPPREAAATERSDVAA